MAANMNGTHVQDALNNLQVIDDDDESFVVLGRSLDDLDVEELDKAFTCSINLNTVTEFQQSIQKELDKSENADQSIKTEKETSCSSLPKVPSFENSAVLENGTKSMASSFSSVTSATPENLQNKIEQLIREKEQLQQTIICNNVNMKEQYDRISQWKEKVQMVHEANKQRILEAKEISQTLKMENSILKKRFNEGLDLVSSFEKQIELLKTELSETVEKLKQTQLKQDQSEKSFKSLIDLKENEIDTVNLEKRQLEDELAEAKKEIADLKSKIDNLQMDISHLATEKLLQSSENTNNFEKNHKIEELERIVAKLYVEKEFVEKENQELKEKLKKVDEIKISNDLVEQKFIEKDERIKELEQICAKAVNENDNLRKEIINVKENITSNTELELRIGNLMDKNEELLKQVEKLKDDRAKVEANAIQNEVQIKAHIESLQKDLQTAFATNVQNEQKFEQTNQQLLNAQAKIAQLEQDLAQGKDVILQKERELATKSDNYFALETQLDIYKNDFEAERSALQQIQQEKNQLANDMQQLQRRNQQLQEEIEMFRERGFVYVANPSGGHSRPMPSAPFTPPGNGAGNSFKCPMCNFGFRDYQSLENHVQRCIELGEALP